MSEKGGTFNLLDEHWLPVLWSDGSYSRVGVLDALTQAHRIRQVAASNPMDRVAVLRFLLALLYWCKGNPPDEEEAPPGKGFPPDWFTKLEANRGCFNLFGSGRRFYQCRMRGPKLSANYLVHEVPTGSKRWHFRHSTDAQNGLCPACCALGLMRLPAFATSGGRGKPPGVNANPPLYVLPVENTLASTLRLSWRPAGASLGTPAWVQPDAALPAAGEVPLLTGLTWLPRRVWLDDPSEPNGSCVACGRPESLVRLTVFVGVGSMKTAEGEAGRIWRDPHVVYETDSQGAVSSLHAANALGAPDAAADRWARVLADLVGSGREGDLLVVGFASVRNDKYVEATETVVRIPRQLAEVQETISALELWRKETWKMARKAHPRYQRSEGRRREHNEVRAAVAAVRPDVEARVSKRAQELLSGGEDGWRQAASEYRPMLRAVARSLAPGATSAALLRRREIENAAPDMRSELQRAGKDTSNKGGVK